MSLRGYHCYDRYSPSIKKTEAIKLIEKYGGIVGSSITAKTDVVIQGYDEETSRKLQRAKEKGIPITNQEGLFNFISNSLKILIE